MGVYLRNNLPKIKDEIYVINITQYKLRRTHWLAWYVNSDNVTYSNIFGVEYTPK